MKLKKRKKHIRMKGIRTHGHSAKLNKGKGSRGGVGLSGTGKRGDQKKSLVINLYGKGYFGKAGVTSRKSPKKKIKFINLRSIQEKYSPGEINLEKYKILGNGDIKGKYVVKAKAASKNAIEKIKKEGGEIILK